MIPSINISQELFERLQRHARPFIDTPEMVIAKGIDLLDKAGNGVVHDNEPVVLDAKGRSLPEYEALNPTDLTFTKLVSATFDGKAVTPPRWNKLLDLAVEQAAGKITDFKKLSQVVGIQLEKGEETERGFRYLPKVGVSVQAQAATPAWKSIMFIAQNLKCPVEVSFIWRNVERAAYPGKTGTMRFG
jgi:hypothetical protein